MFSLNASYSSLPRPSFQNRRSEEAPFLLMMFLDDETVDIFNIRAILLGWHLIFLIRSSSIAYYWFRVTRC